MTVMLYMAALGIWGVVAYLRGQSVSGSFAGAMVIGEIVVVAQVLAGLALFAEGARPPTATHYLYGVSAILVLPFVWSIYRERDQRQAVLIYGLVSLFVFGLAVRGIMTGR